MKVNYLLGAFLTLFIGGAKAPNSKQVDPNLLTGNISLNLKHGVWRLLENKPIFQDLTLDLTCERSKCQSQIWGYAPKFNPDVDHQGSVKVVNKNNAWLLDVDLKILPNPWSEKTENAKYTIELVPYKDNLIGSYTGNYNNRNLQGKVRGTVEAIWPKPMANFSPLQPQEHPRLIFRSYQVDRLREKAKTPEGKAILAQLDRSLKQPIDYGGYVPNGGYHATGHCLLSLLKDDPKPALTAWKIVEKSMDNPGRRLLEHSTVVAGVALAYDLCYQQWGHREKVATWLYHQSDLLLKGDSPKKGGWNSNAWSNWQARAKGASGLAALAILNDPLSLDKAKLERQSPLYIAQRSERNIKRYFTKAIGNQGFGAEGDHYTTEPWVLTVIPFLQAYQNVLGQDLVTDSKAAWMLPHYVMRSLNEDGTLPIATYGRHGRYAGKSLFAMGLGIVPESYLTAVMWVFDRSIGLQGDRSFGIQLPYEAAYILAGYPEQAKVSNPGEILDRTSIDEEKGFYVFRNRWQDDRDFIASIYTLEQPLEGSWRFPDVGSFRIWGLGGRWAITSPSREGAWDKENVVTMPDARPWQTGRSIVFQSRRDGSGIVSLVTNPITRPKSDPPVGVRSIRSFAVDYSGISGSPGLFVVVDKFVGAVREREFQDKIWMMHTDGNVSIRNNTFTITSDNGAAMQGTFIAPRTVQLSSKQTATGNKISARGGDEFFVVMTVQQGKAPPVIVSGSGLATQVKVGKQGITFEKDRVVLTNF